MPLFPQRNTGAFSSMLSSNLLLDEDSSSCSSSPSFFKPSPCSPFFSTGPVGKQSFVSHGHILAEAILPEDMCRVASRSKEASSEDACGHIVVEAFVPDMCDVASSSDDAGSEDARLVQDSIVKWVRSIRNVLLRRCDSPRRLDPKLSTISCSKL